MLGEKKKYIQTEVERALGRDPGHVPQPHSKQVSRQYASVHARENWQL